MVAKNSTGECKSFDETKAEVEGVVEAKTTKVPPIFGLPPGALDNKIPTVSASIPLIEFASIHESALSREGIVEKIKDAAEKWGIFQVINHGVPLSVLEEIQNGVVRFHEEDPEVKRSYFSLDFAKKFIYHNNFELYGNKRDSFAGYMAPDPPQPEELPVACSERKAFDETKAGVKGLVDAQITEVPRIFHLPPSDLLDKKPSASASDFEAPVIDLAEVQVDGVSRKAIIEKVRYAAGKWGFFQVINHGVPLNVLEEIKEGVRRFHEEDLEVKKSYFSRDFTKTFIYHNNFDLYSSSSSVNWRDTFACYMAPVPPKPEELPEACRGALIEYAKHVMSLGDLLFELLSEALGLNSDAFKRMGCLKGLLMLGNYYPPCPQPDLTLGISKHSDNSFLTILLQDHIGGLQVLHQDFWIDVSPLPGALVINIGDFLQMMTKDKFGSAEHRVLANKTGPRISVTSFFSTSMLPNSTVYGPIKELLSEENPPRYRLHDNRIHKQIH